MIDTNIFISAALFPNGKVAQALRKDIGIAFPVCFTSDLDGYKYFGEQTIYPKEYTAHCF